MSAPAPSMFSPAAIEVAQRLGLKMGRANLEVFADTVKGKGVSFMEDVAKWHHGVPTDSEYAAAMKELDDAIARAGGGEGARA